MSPMCIAKSGLHLLIVLTAEIDLSVAKSFTGYGEAPTSSFVIIWVSPRTAKENNFEFDDKTNLP